ncbi:MAG: glycosyl hydrolase 53 family protein [Bacteroidales bacterium]|nr:glycosyl hydrolase 53 family protein [Bacteroidales bacterium]
MKSILILLAALFLIPAHSQEFYFGADLSYANMMEDCGAEFKENGIPEDVYHIFSDHGFNLIRVRMWYEPAWQDSLVQPVGVKNRYNDFEDIKEAIQRAKSAGMQVMLGIQLSNFWADPVKQIIPPSWVDVASDTEILKDSVYNYVTRVLTDLDRDSLMPDIVKIGNENNGGVLRHTTLTGNYTASGSVSNDWSRHAQLFNSAIKAVRDVSSGTSVKPEISLHYAGTSSLSWWYQNIINNGVTDFDIIGFSYYYAWHGGSISNLGSVIKSMKTSFPGYEIMVVETGYLWTTMNYDNLGNIITTPDPMYLPVIPEKQHEYMVDMTREVMNAGGTGIVFWEPAWVSTPCRTPWGQGSSQEHVAFFDVEDYNFMSNGAGTWPESPYFNELTTKKVTFKVDMTGQDVSKGVWITGSWTGEDWYILPAISEGNNIYSYFTYLSPGDSGAFYFLNDSTWAARETVPSECATWLGTDRTYKAGELNQVYSFKWGTCDPIGPPSDVSVTFKVDMTSQDVSNGVWITGMFTGNPWKILRMTQEANNIYSYTTVMHPGDSGAYYFMYDDVWGSRESVPGECAPWWGIDRDYKIGERDTTYAFIWGTCQHIGEHVNSIPSASLSDRQLSVYPNPANGLVTLTIKSADGHPRAEIFDYTGKMISRLNLNEQISTIDVSSFQPGLYMIRYSENESVSFEKFIIY